MSMSRSEVLSKCRGLQAQLARVRENYGLAKADEGEGDILQKRDVRFAKGTAENNPPLEWVDGQRTLLAELIAEGVARANADVRSAMLRSPAFLALMREAEKDPYVQRVLIESILEAERVAGGPEQSPASVPIAGNYAIDVAAFEAAQERGRRLDVIRELVKKPIGDIVAYRYAQEAGARVIDVAQVIAGHLAAGRPDISSAAVAKAVAASKPDKEPMVDYGLRKSDGTPMDARDLGKPRRMQPGEILR